ncbi:CinA family protein [Stakelama saccharophila]|uniref:CinA family protein n=1 Tax=Stakelama saccharophila TaxID=3075605 RepID=A0ABZ0B5A3_9SPHN|nr:CinA family protein [Stakelama sp. W311]WNO52544.1 CinA family protein [Stakelama sp. W311]
METILPASLVDLARKVVETNREAGRRIAVAESCTGGLVSAALTEIPGSSDVFEAGFITYSNEAKRELLDVSLDLLETFGSVSVAVAWAMAQGVLDETEADVAVAVTGIAGPDGGTEKKPVGTVVFARAKKGADPKEVIADSRNFDDEGRGSVRLQAALCALELLMPGSEPLSPSDGAP